MEWRKGGVGVLELGVWDRSFASMMGVLSAEDCRTIEFEPVGNAFTL